MEHPSCTRCVLGNTTIGELLNCSICRLCFHRPCLGPKFNESSNTDAIICSECDVNNRIGSLQNELIQLNHDLTVLQNQLSVEETEEFMYETIDRIKRAKNIIVYNFPESQSPNEESRHQDDRFRIIREISRFCSIDMTNIHVYRLGVSNIYGPRPLKVFLKQEYDVRTVMENRHRCVAGLRFSLDKTVLQRRIDQHAFDVLLRYQDGYKTIKYVRGEPVIVEADNRQNIVQAHGLDYNGVTIYHEEPPVESDEER